MTDVTHRSIAPPSPHYTGPLPGQYAPMSAGRYEVMKLRPEACSLAVPAALCTLLIGTIIVTLVVVAAEWLVNTGYWPELHDVSSDYTDLDTLLQVMNHKYSDFYGVSAAAVSLFVVCFVLLIPTFIWWFQRAYRNLAYRDFHPAWAYVGWFVPIVNLWKPKELANRIWRISVSPTLSIPIQWWWFGPWAMLGINFFNNQAMQQAGRDGNYEAIGVLLGLGVLTQATVPVAGLLMIRTVTRAQERLIVAARANADV